MLVVVASRFDDEARALVNQWGPGVAQVLVPQGLSKPDWRWFPDHDESSTAVLNDTAVRVADITGVLTLMPVVIEHELDHIVEEDRSYVAAEIHAFLFAWLSALRCPVINRPADGGLSGPPWTPERWTWEAHRAGLDTRRPEPRDDASVERLTIVGDRVFPADAGCLDVIGRLARAAGIDMMCVSLVQGRFVHASSRPHLATPGVAEALCARLSGSRL